MHQVTDSISRGLCVAAIALVSSACDGNKPHSMPPDAAPDAAPDAPPDAGPTYVRETVVELAATPSRDLDLLFVIDDSPSMLDKQLNLKNNFPSFISSLSALPGGLPNLHIGVVTSDMGTKASGSPTPAPTIGQIGQGGCSGTGKNGNLQVGGAAADLASGAVFLVDVADGAGGRSRNYTGDLSTVFGKLASVGAGGCGFEQPLAAVRAALGNNPANAGFLRAQALLGVLFLSDEDDCSARSPTLFDMSTATLGPLNSFRCTRFGVTCATGGATPDAMNLAGAKSGCGASMGSAYIDDVGPYRDFLAALKSGARRVVVGGIMGNIEPVAVELKTPPGGGTPTPALAHSCAYQGAVGPEVADPAVRLQSFFGRFPRSAWSTVCQPDLSPGQQQLAALIQEAMEGSCVDGPLADVDPSTPGAQVDCVVEDVVGAAATPIAACDASPTARPCWQLQSDPARCAFSVAPHQRLVVQRATVPDPATVTRMRCLR